MELEHFQTTYWCSTVGRPVVYGGIKMKSYLVKVSGSEHQFIEMQCARLHCKKSYYLRILLFQAIDKFPDDLKAGLYIRLAWEKESPAAALRTVQVYIPDSDQEYLQKIRRLAAGSRLSEAQIVQCFINTSLESDLIGEEDEAL